MAVHWLYHRGDGKWRMFPPDDAQLLQRAFEAQSDSG